MIAVNGTGLRYESRGSSAPLVVLGGLGLSVSEMGVLTGPLSERFPAPDQQLLSAVMLTGQPSR